MPKLQYRYYVVLIICILGLCLIIFLHFGKFFNTMKIDTFVSKIGEINPGNIKMNIEDLKKNLKI